MIVGTQRIIFYIAKYNEQIAAHFSVWLIYDIDMYIYYNYNKLFSVKEINVSHFINAINVVLGSHYEHVI